MTSKPKKALPTHVEIWKDRAVSSTALCEQITSVDIGRFSDFMGSLSEEEMQELDKALAISIGLPLPHEPQEASSEEECDEDDLAGDDSDDGWVLTVTRLQAERDLYEKLYTDLLNKLTREGTR